MSTLLGLLVAASFAAGAAVGRWERNGEASREAERRDGLVRASRRLRKERERLEREHHRHLAGKK